MILTYYPASQSHYSLRFASRVALLLSTGWAVVAAAAKWYYSTLDLPASLIKKMYMPIFQFLTQSVFFPPSPPSR